MNLKENSIKQIYIKNGNIDYRLQSILFLEISKKKLEFDMIFLYNKYIYV